MTTRSTKATPRMANYSAVFVETLDEFVSPYVPGDQGDAGKGQVLVRAGFKINTTINPNIGYISKTEGQTNFHLVAVDALLDRSDASGADYLTDIPQPDGSRLIAVAYTPYATPPPGTPTDNWVQPTADYLSFPGPLTLKSTTTPEPPVTTDELLEALTAIQTTQTQHTDMLARLQEQQAADTALIRADISDFRAWVQSQIDHLEDFVNKLGKLIWWRRRPDEPEDTP